MNIAAFLTDIITFQKKPLRRRWLKLKVLVNRFIYSFLKKNFDNGKNIKEIPVIINNRNRITYLLQLIEWLEKHGFKNIYIIDNASSYPPLIEYYRKTNYKVFYLKENVGHLALWKSDIYNLFKRDYFIYSDPDVLPAKECPDDAIDFFMAKLKQYKNLDKIGFGLKMDDLPEHYEDKKKVIEWEKQFWIKKVEEEIYDAPIDTTFALYRPFSNGNILDLKSYRTAGKYIAHHLPWYENSAQPTEENLFYKKNIRIGASHWIRNDSI